MPKNVPLEMELKEIVAFIYPNFAGSRQCIISATRFNFSM